MSRICLDTSAYSHFKRGHAEAVEIIASASWIGLPSIVLGELRVGFMLGRRPRDNERELRAFTTHAVVSVLDVDDAAAQIYAEIVSALRRAGTPLPTNDIWIGALAAREGARVLTYDIHFESMPRIGATVLALGG